MLQLVLLSLISSSATPGTQMLREPAVQATCAGSLPSLALGTGNVGGNLQSTSTSVINIWAFLPERGGSAAAWVFKRAVDDYYIQFAATSKPSNFRKLRFYWRYFKGDGPFVPVSVTPAQLVSIENVLGSMGYVRASCFTHDYAM